ncbi:MAG TPA: hypothetical protein VFG94_03670 [Acidimicrobiales bacterium]|jgi:hypothetical protein|nr:hypothetical protein [Acidimicrobiales bacterium]
MQSIVAAGAGFLLAVLWFDLMFDVQVLRHRDDDVPEVVLASIAAYYRRVTTDARPLNRLVAATMLATLLAIVLQAMGDDVPRWVSVVSAVAAAAPIGLAAARTVPSAVRLGTRRDPLETQRTLARSICRDHLFCLAAIATLLAVQLVWA